MKTNIIFKPGINYLTDGGLETTMIYKRNIDLNYFAAYELLASESGTLELQNYYNDYLDLALKRKMGFILETPTWRASPDWGYKMGYTNSNLQTFNQGAIHFLRYLAEIHPINTDDVLVSGCVGPRGDGYFVNQEMSVSEAKAYHTEQIQTFALSDADLITALTMNYCNEAIGIALAAKELGTPVVISFTVETDGKLPDGTTLKEAIQMVDEVTKSYVSYFMINCAHPDHFMHVIRDQGDWKKKIKGIRANASCKSHAELDASTSLDEGDKSHLAQGYLQIQELLPEIKLIGGCCGTDHSHIEEICDLIAGNTSNNYKVVA